MSDLLRLATYLGSARAWTAVAVLLGAATLISNTGLLATATYLVSAAASHPPLVELAGALYLVRLFGLSRAFTRYGERLVSHDVTFRLLHRLRCWLYARLLRLSLGQLVELRAADVLASLVRDVEEAQTLFLHVLAPGVLALLTLAIISVALWQVDAALAAAAAITLLAVGPASAAAFVWTTGRLEGARVEARAQLDVQTAEVLEGLPDLLAFGQSEQWLRANQALADGLQRIETQLAVRSALRVALQDTLARLGAWGVLVLTIPLVAAHALPAAYVAVLAVLVLGGSEAFQPLAHAAQRLGATRAAAARNWAVADRQPALTYPPSTTGLTATTMRLAFERVSFTYPERPRPVLTDISLSVSPGQAKAIVGPSGAGKSTVLLLAVRAWDATSGHIRLNGLDLRDCSPSTLTHTIGALTHDSSIFSTSLRNNLRLAAPGASDLQLESALERVGLAHLLEGLPQGLSTWLGDAGARLSGGERQRLALARLVLRDCPLLVLDEPTANLDPVSASAIMDLIRQLSRTHAILLSSHRLADLDWLDELLVLDGGRIVERGRDADLRRAGGLYQRLAEAEQELFVTAGATAASLGPRGRGRAPLWRGPALRHPGRNRGCG